MKLSDLLKRIDEMQAAVSGQSVRSRFMTELFRAMGYIAQAFCGAPLPTNVSPEVSATSDPVATLEIDKLAPGIAAKLVLAWLNRAANMPTGVLATCVRKSIWFKGNGELLRDQVHVHIAACAEHEGCRAALDIVDNDTSELRRLVGAMLKLVQNHPGLHLRSVFGTVLTDLLRIYVRQPQRRRGHEA